MTKKTTKWPIGMASLLSCGTALAQSPSNPNIVFVFPDQFRNCSMEFWNDATYADKVRWKADPAVTPRLREFAGQSVVLSNAVSNCPISSPYRGIFLTGMYPERSGIQSNCMSLRPTCSLAPDAECISDVLNANGYECAYIGKFHAQFPTPNNPQKAGTYVEERWPAWDAYTEPHQRHGFDWWYSYGTFDEHFNPHYWDNEGRRTDPHEFSVKHEVDKAIEFLQGRDDKTRPFFLCLGMNPPHSPYSDEGDCNACDLDLYRNKSLKELYVRENADTTMEKAPSMRYYLANVTAVDREFGRLMDYLREAALDENTIVVFTSDHGETMCSHGVQDPKNSIWTEAFNVPFIIRYPRVLEHRTDDMLLSTIDIMPTLLSLAGLADKVPATAEGRDLAPALRGEKPSGVDCALYIRNLNGEPDPDGMIRKYFPQARGIKTARYTFEVSIKRDGSLAGMKLFDDWSDPYQLHSLKRSSNKALYRSMLAKLRDKLRESNDVWYRESILDKISTSL